MTMFTAATNLGARSYVAAFRRLHAGNQSSSSFPPQVGLLQFNVGTIPSIRRDYSSSSPKQQNASSNSEKQNNERKWTLLYHRSTSRASYPRALFGVSCFNLTYWTWYVADFVPSVNSSAHAKAALGQIDAQTLDMLLVDPNMGYVGFGMASVIWLGAFLYSRQLVSAIWAPMGASSGEEQRSTLAVSTLKLPFLTQPKILKRTVYDPESNAFDRVENIAFTESELKAESSVEFFAPGDLTLSEEQKKNDVIVKLDGDFSRLRGHIPLKKEDSETEDGMLANFRQQRYLLDIESEQEIMTNANDILVHSLVLKDYHLQARRKGGRHSSNGETIKRKKGFHKRRRR
mmetsp:Transcript_20643/g.44810  ORF Transcript_20643/g.44810 Transcript_20643/m.44810 type:complete len:345 (+) Transcript_20643:91-1125(+)